MPAGTVDVSVDGEWSFAQTLRHLVLATDMWLGRAILELEQPFHPLGQPNAEHEADGFDMSVFTTDTPSYAEVLEVRAGRVAMVRDFLATVTPDELAATRTNPWDPEHPETVLSCLHVILEEEWEHHRYAVRDLDAIEAESHASPSTTLGERLRAPRLRAMSALTRDEVAHLAMLARIDLSDAELDRMSGELAVILESVARVGQVAADDIPPTSHPLPLTNVTRPDEVRPSLGAEAVLAGAPAAEQQRFAVPRILDED